MVGGKPDEAEPAGRLLLDQVEVWRELLILLALFMLTPTPFLSLSQTIDQFEYDGCDNCDAYLQMKGNREMVYDCTSSSFDG